MQIVNRVILVTCMMFCFVVSAGNAEVTLRSLDGSVTLTGELDAANEHAYIINSKSHGVLVVEAAKFDCIGSGCPEERRSTVLGIHGSNTIGAQLMPALVERYGESIQATVEKRIGTNPEEVKLVLKDSKGAEVSIIDLQSHGSGSSAPGLASGKAEIGMSSRVIKPEEMSMLANAGLTTESHVVALDGLLVLVSPNNPMSTLSLEQIAKIFSGQITDWAQLGQKARKINVYRRGDKSGTFDTFDQLVLKPFNQKITTTAKTFESNAELSDEVARDPDGIGFVGFAYLRNAKAVTIAGSCGMTSKPTPFNVKSEEYPLSRRLYLYTTNKAGTQALKLLDFALSDEAQGIVAENGYVEQSPDYLDFAQQTERLAGAVDVPDADFNLNEMRLLMADIRGARRLSTTFRFNLNSVQLDEKAQQDIKRLASLITSSLEGKEIFLIGFGDASGPYDSGRIISINRANAVKTALLKAGGQNLDAAKIVTKGYSKLMPVACNDTVAGRQRNRRVEVWVQD